MNLYLADNQLEAVPHIPDSVRILHLQVGTSDTLYPPITVQVVHGCWRKRIKWDESIPAETPSFFPEQQHHGGQRRHFLPVQWHLLPATQPQRGAHGRQPRGAVQVPRQLHLHEGTADRTVSLRRNKLYCRPFLADGAVWENWGFWIVFGCWSHGGDTKKVSIFLHQQTYKRFVTWSGRSETIHWTEGVELSLPPFFFSVLPI